MGTLCSFCMEIRPVPPAGLTAREQRLLGRIRCTPGLPELYQALRDHVRQGNYAPRERILAGQLSICKKTIQRGLRALEQAGAIQIFKVGRVNHYRLPLVGRCDRRRLSALSSKGA